MPATAPREPQQNANDIRDWYVYPESVLAVDGFPEV